jgi:hypothetical protein
MASETIAARWMQPHATRTVTAVVAIALVIRFAAFAQEGAEGFHAATLPSQRLVGAIRASNPSLPPDRMVDVDRRIAEAVPEIYRDAVAEAAFCAAGVRLILR